MGLTVLLFEKKKKEEKKCQNGIIYNKNDLISRMATIVKEEEPDEPEPQLAAPEVIMALEDSYAEEGDSAKFMVKITGYPRPRVNWFVNKTLCVNVIIFLGF